MKSSIMHKQSFRIKVNFSREFAVLNQLPGRVVRVKLPKWQRAKAAIVDFIDPVGPYSHREKSILRRSANGDR
jgi:hypothetical protein